MKSKVLIYAYDREFAPIIRSKVFNTYFDVVGISSLAGWGLCGKDAGFADDGLAIGKLVENKYEEYFDSCDTVIFANPEHGIDTDKVLAKIRYAIDNKKNIISLLDQTINQQVEEYAHKNGVDIKVYENSTVKSRGNWENKILI